MKDGIILIDTHLANGGGGGRELDEVFGAFNEWVKYGAWDVDCTYEVNACGHLIRIPNKPKE
jgi:hypothetical protein